MPFLLELAWRDLRATGHRLWVLVACLLLGVSLVTASSGLYRLVTDAVRQDVRQLLGGDVEIESRQALPPAVQAWMVDHAVVNAQVGLRTMLRDATGRAQLIELISNDDAYPLYGQLLLQPAGPLPTTLAQRDGHWGAAIDSTLASRMGLQMGDRVEIGELVLVVRAVVQRQPDRSLRADWGAAPVLVAPEALKATGLVQALSRMEYRYRVRTTEAPNEWRDAFVAAFPALDAEVRTVDERSDRMAEVLAQVGSGLVLIGFSALFIGGLGVFNSVQAFLQGQLTSLATLRALGMRQHRLAAWVLLQLMLMAGLASAAGALLGLLLAWTGGQMVTTQLPLTLQWQGLWPAALTGMVFGLLTALVFALPALGRALTVTPAALFRGLHGQVLHTPRYAWWLTLAAAGLTALLLLGTLPDMRFGLAFVLAVALLLAVLALGTRALRWLAARGQHHPRLPLPLQLALADLQQPQSPLRTTLLSLGSALTLLVACTLVVATLLRTVNDTVPAQAPALVFHDVQTDQLPLLRDTLAASPGLQAVRTAPLVLGRLVGVNGTLLRDSANRNDTLEARDEHKLSDISGNFDDVLIRDGAWWPDDHAGEALVAMEDREADELGLQVGDRLRFEIMGQAVEARLVAIYSQRRLQSRLWLEAIFSPGVLDPWVTRHVGAAWMPTDQTLSAQDRLARVAPNIATARTENLLRETRSLLGRASGGLAVVAGVCLAASLLVLASVVTASRSRQVYDATVMHALGARHGLLRAVLLWEYLLLAATTAGFALLAGSLLGTGLLLWRLEQSPLGLYWSGALTALGVSGTSLGLGARYLLAQMRLNPAMLLRTTG